MLIHGDSFTYDPEQTLDIDQQLEQRAPEAFVCMDAVNSVRLSTVLPVRDPERADHVQKVIDELTRLYAPARSAQNDNGHTVSGPSLF